MLNVKTLTDTLSRMELPELQQYAALHKNDPYVVSLALSIANQKKQAGVAKAGQMGMLPQPKVVDQDIANMAAPQQTAQAMPENVGIGQLPAPNMQRMAGGGIVAFDDGGAVPSFAGGGDIPDWVKQLPPDSGIRMYYEKQARGEPLFTEPLLDTLGRTFKNATQPTAKPTAAPAAPVTMSGTPNLPVTPPTVPGIPSALPPAVAATKPPAPAPVVKPATGLPALNTKPMTAAEASAASKQFGDEGQVTSAVDKLRADTEKTNADIKAGYDTGKAALPEVGSQAEARLKKQEAEDAIGQADAKGMAIFKAGLAMLSGTSQNAFENIGKGALAGLEEYSGSIKEFRKLARERDKAYADIENARVAAARDDLKTATGLQERAADRLARVEEKGVDVTATLFKTNKDTASLIWRDSNDQAQANAREQYGQQMANQRAIMQANAPSPQERMYTKLGGGNLEAGMRKYSDIMGPEAKGLTALIAAYAKDPTALKLLEQTNPQLATQIKQQMQMMMLQPQSTPTGAVRP